MPFKGLIFDTDGHLMSPTFGHGRGGQIYRYYVSAPLQQGRGRAAGDDQIRRVPAEAVETLVFDRLERLSQSRPGMAAASTLLKRVEIHAASVHLQLHGDVLFGVHADLRDEVSQLGHRLAPGERLVQDELEPKMIRLILPVRLKLRGGRTWIVTPEGSSALPKAKADRALVTALRAGHRVVKSMEIAGRNAKAPKSPYARQISLLAFLAPDIQSAILQGRQPPGFNLEGLVHGSVPLAWADQRAAFGF